MEESNDRIIAYYKQFDREKEMPTAIIPTLHLTRVYDKLIATYGEPKNEPDYDPLRGLISTILSQHTSDINSERAYQQLIATFPPWEQVRNPPPHLLSAA